MLLGLGAALLAALLYGVAAVLQAAAARQVDRVHGLDLRLLLAMARRPVTAVTLVLLLAGFVLHLVAVRLVPLFLAQAGIAVSLVVTAMLAVAVFADRLGALEWAAVGAVVVGLVLLSASAGVVGSDRAQGALTEVLAACVAVIAALGAAASRRGGAWATAGLGLLAGLGYAVVGVCSRVLPTADPVQVWREPVAYVLGAAGVLAFTLYSMALQRGSVTLSTTPMIVTQTIAPALVGLALLGDGVRSGWGPAAVLGLVLTVAAASALVRFEGAAGAGAPPRERVPAGEGPSRGRA